MLAIMLSRAQWSNQRLGGDPENLGHMRWGTVYDSTRSFTGITPFIMISILLLFFSYPSFAEEKILPRFTTIKSNHVNARTGPGITYPIEWVFVSRGEPVKVTAEFEQWRKVEDINGPVGWIHSSILSPKRSVVITCKDQHILLKSPQKDSRIVAKLEKGLRCNLDKVERGWCKLKCKSYKGWVEANYVWGITKSEAQLP